MKKLLTITLGAILTLSLAACQNAAPAKNNAQRQPNAQTAEEDSTQIPNPFTECETIEEGVKIAGFSITVPEKMPEGYNLSHTRAVKDEMLEISYKNGENTILIRKGIGSEDISGDYNAYEENDTITVDNLQIATKENSGKVYTATWVDGDYAYSVSVNPESSGIDKSVIKEMTGSIQ